MSLAVKQSLISSEHKSILARLLATENIDIRINPQLPTAAFDTKNRVLYLPKWDNISNDLTDLLIVHEDGHALHTPAGDEWVNACKRIAAKFEPNPKEETIASVKDYLNVVEDCRIDKIQKRKFPGSKTSYLNGYKELYDRDFFSLKGKDPNKLSLVDRINLYYKGGMIHLPQVTFHNEAEQDLADRCGKTESWDEVVKLSEELYEYCSTHDTGESGGTGSNLMAGGAAGDGEDGDGDGEGGDGNKDGKDGKNSSVGRKGGRGVGGHRLAPIVHTAKALQDALEKTTAKTGQYIYLNMPEVNHKLVVVDYKELYKGYGAVANSAAYSSDWEKFRTRESPVAAYMAKEFEMKKAAEVSLRAKVDKTGVIDMTRAHSYKYNDDIFRRQTILPKGKNHGMIIVIDWSGSMSGIAKKTIEQALTLTMFCKRVGIPFEVYLFTDTDRERNNFKYSGECVSLGFVSLKNILSSRMNSADFQRAARFLCTNKFYSIESMGGTPLNEAIVNLTSIAEEFRDKNKIEILTTLVITDGAGSYPGITNASPGNSYYNSRSRSYSGGTTIVIRDKNTKIDYQMSYAEFMSYKSTAVFLEMLKHKTGSNTIGLYLGHDFESEFDTWGTYRVARTSAKTKEVQDKTKVSERRIAAQKSWKDNGFFAVDNIGFDQYYIVNSRALAISNKTFSQTGTLDISDKKLSGLSDAEANAEILKAQDKLASAFMEFNKNRKVNRIFLNRFVENIAKKIV